MGELQRDEIDEQADIVMVCIYCGRQPDILRLKFYTIDCCIECHKNGMDRKRA